MKPIVVVSKCLGFANCRYNGQTVPDAFVQRLKDFVEFLPVCPEVEIGLGVPRDSIRIVMHEGRKTLYQPATGKDVTALMQGFTERYLKDLKEVDGFILKYASPSCGSSNVRIYPSMERAVRPFRGSGFFGGAIHESFPDLPIEDEGRLTNLAIREHFLTCLFCMAELRTLPAEPNELIRFHTRHKMLLLAYSQKHMRQLGKVVAEQKESGIDAANKSYRDLFRQALARPPKQESIINVLQHAFGGLSEELSSEERRFFVNSLEEYRDERIPLSTLMYLLQSHALRFKNNYLLDQSFMQPYPKGLVDLGDSGKR